MINHRLIATHDRSSIIILLSYIECKIQNTRLYIYTNWTTLEIDRVHFQWPGEFVMVEFIFNNWPNFVMVEFIFNDRPNFVMVSLIFNDRPNFVPEPWSTKPLYCTKHRVERCYCTKHGNASWLSFSQWLIQWVSRFGAIIPWSTINNHSAFIQHSMVEYSV
jgi:hypothetical protein